MKRSFVLFLAASLAVMLPAGLACAQVFTDMTFDVYQGWTASESDSGIVRMTANSDEDAVIVLMLGQKGSSTLQQIANNLYQSLGGEGGISQLSGGGYMFSHYNNAGIKFNHMIRDHSTYSKVPEGYYFVMSVTPDSDANGAFIHMQDTIVFHPGGSPSPNDNSGGGSGGGYTGGTTRTFSRMSFIVPNGWTPQETEDGIVVTIYEDNSNGASYIRFGVATNDGMSLEAIANRLYQNNNGRNLERASSGYYSFYFTNSSGGSSVAFVDDSTTDSRVPGGYFWVQFVRTKTDSSVWKAVLNSFRITIGNNNTGNNSNTDTGSDTPIIIENNYNLGTGTNTDDKAGTVNNYYYYYGDNSGNQQGNDGYIGNRPSKNTDVSLSGGGCSAGFGALALLALCSAFIVRKSR